MKQQIAEIPSQPSRYDHVLDRAIELTPKVTGYLLPENAVDVRQGIKDGSMTAPVCPGLREADFATPLSELEKLTSSVKDEGDRLSVYFREAIDENVLKYRLLQAMQDRLGEMDSTRRDELADTINNLNEKIYGLPDEGVYHSLVSDIKQLELDGANDHGRRLYEELIQQLPSIEAEASRFRPSQETIEWMNGVVNELYGGLLRHVPERDEPFTPQEIAEVFENIIRQEFGEAADDWSVVVRPASSIEVNRITKTIVIPEDRPPVSYQKLRELVVHEIGVHMLRGVMGYELNSPLAALGFASYRDLEEGTGKVAEQALGKQYQEAGVAYYLIASMMRFDQKNSHEVYEALWRYHALKKDVKVTDESITKAQDLAARQVARMTQGTGDLPLMMDLAYFNGTYNAWKYFEENRGDDMAVAFFFMGRGDPTNPGQRAVMMGLYNPDDTRQVTEEDFTWASKRETIGE